MKVFCVQTLKRVSTKLNSLKTFSWGLKKLARFLNNFFNSQFFPCYTFLQPQIGLYEHHSSGCYESFAASRCSRQGWVSRFSWKSSFSLLLSSLYQYFLYLNLLSFSYLGQFLCLFTIRTLFLSHYESSRRRHFSFFSFSSHFLFLSFLSLCFFSFSHSILFSLSPLSSLFSFDFLFIHFLFLSLFSSLFYFESFYLYFLFLFFPLL